jgi:hypothetical protein
VGDDKDDKKDDKEAKRARKEREKQDKKALLGEIRDTLGEIRREQRALRREVERLSSRIGAGMEGMEGEPSDEIIDFFDRLRALEAGGELAFGAWIRTCEDDRLRGGLRTIQLREASHARLLGERMEALGGVISDREPGSRARETIDCLASDTIPDHEKLRELLSRYPDVEAAVAPIHEMADRLGPDHETRALLETIAADERATLGFLHAEYERLAKRLEGSD